MPCLRHASEPLSQNPLPPSKPSSQDLAVGHICDWVQSWNGRGYLSACGGTSVLPALGSSDPARNRAGRTEPAPPENLPLGRKSSWYVHPIADAPAAARPPPPQKQFERPNTAPSASRKPSSRPERHRSKQSPPPPAQHQFIDKRNRGGPGWSLIRGLSWASCLTWRGS